MTRTSLIEVARVSGVSLATASRVLNPDNGHPVRAAVRERVLATAEELNYNVNALARGVKTGRTRTVAVMVHDICDPYFNLMARGVTNAADAAGYLTLVCNSERDPETELRYVQLALEQRVAGVLFVGSGFASRRYGTKLRRQIAALAGYGAHVVALGPRGSRMPAEVADSRGGARQATQHLIDLGHERIAYVDGPPALLINEERRAGYMEALEQAGIPFDEALVLPGGFTTEGGAAAMRELLNRRNGATAVFASNDRMAIGCVAELTARGVRIPGDLSLVGFDDIPDVRWFAPPLTTVAVPMTEIGEASMERMLVLLGERDGPAGKQPMVNVHPTELIVRGSTAPPRRHKRAKGAR